MKENIEQDWVQRARRREPAAIAQLYRRYWRAARATAYGATGDLHLAEDAASEAFYAAMESLANLRDTTRFGPWLRTIGLRTARRLKTSVSAGNGIEMQTFPDAESSAPGDSLERWELAALIHEAVRNLSETLREAVSLFYFEGYSVKEAADFLDVCEGTLKRRLHEGRKRLWDAAEQIIKGKKLMNPNRQQILQQLRDLVDKGPDSVDSRRILRQVLQLRPLPYKLMAEFLRRHSNTAKRMATPKGREEVKRRSRKIMEFVGQPSERALDPDHVVGKAAQAIRAALGEFKEWQVDISHAARNLVERFSGNMASFNLPPGFAEGVAGSYVYTTRAWLFQSDDGSMRTMYELIQDENIKHLKDTECISKGRLSDALVLMWMQSNTIELRAVEELLRRLCGVIAPDTPVSLSAYEEPRYRAALRMQFADIPIPAAIGGPLNPWPNMPQGVNAACVLIYLEPWATARSGQVIELIDFPLSLLKRD